MQSSNESLDNAAPATADKQPGAEAMNINAISGHDILMNMPDGVIVQAAGGEILLCNPAAERILGFNTAEMAHPGIDPHWQAIHEDGMPFLDEHDPARIALRTGEPQTGVVMGIHDATGAVTWIASNSQPLFRAGETLPYAVITTLRDVTARTEAERALHENEAYLHTLARFPDDIPHPVLRVGSDGVVLYANAHSAPLLEHWKSGVNKTVPKNIRWLIADTLDVKNTHDMEVTIKDQTFLLTFAPDASGNYINVYGLNITDRKQDEVALQESEKTTRMFIDSAPVGVVIVDEAGIIILVNSIAAKLFGYSNKYEMLGRPLDMLIPEGNRSVHMQHCADYFENPHIRPMSTNMDLRALRKDGSSFPAEISLGAIKTQKGKLAMAFVVDISARHEVEQLRDAMLHTMVHDLRSPLSSILTAMHMITMEGVSHLDEGQQQLLEIAVRGAERLLNLVNAILDVSRLESGKMPLERAYVVPNHLVTHALETFAPLIEEKNITLGIDVPLTLPPVWVDTRLVERVLQNLVGNALKFTPEGGAIRIFAAQDEQYPAHIQVAVNDTGPGISPELRPRLFQKFVTGQVAGRGSGLGLAFCKLVIETHGERIWAESEVGKGTTFTFTLPAPEL
ncbi:MAG: PAS domain S-box protein [Anaerolineae bacterium]|nr:PAS domain S-box protein [Anaerolineae bacterium]